MESRKCWTCGSEHDLDEACRQSAAARSARAAGGAGASLLFGQGASADASESRLGQVFTARFDSECASCDGAIYAGDDIRSDGQGGYIHALSECEENL